MIENVEKTTDVINIADRRVNALISECKYREVVCRHISVSLYLWLRNVRFFRRLFVMAPIIFGAVATWSILGRPEDPITNEITAILALLAGFSPALFCALKLDLHIDKIAAQAALFRALGDRFRQAGNITALGPANEFNAAFDSLVEWMESARMTSLNPPGRYFGAARKRIAAGRDFFDVGQADA